MKKRNLLLIFFVILLLCFGAWLKRFLAIDSCLDNGGRWNYERKECVNYQEALEVDKCLNAGGQWDYEKKVCTKL